MVSLQTCVLFLAIWNGQMAIVFKKVKWKGPVTKIENIKTDATKILRPTHIGE
jgi:hypothetical protein